MARTPSRNTKINHDSRDVSWSTGINGAPSDFELLTAPGGHPSSVRTAEWMSSPNAPPASVFSSTAQSTVNNDGKMSVDRVKGRLAKIHSHFPESQGIQNGQEVAGRANPEMVPRTHPAPHLRECHLTNRASLLNFDFRCSHTPIIVITIIMGRPCRRNAVA